MLWGQEEREKGKTTMPFFSGDKVLLERKALDGPWVGGGWGTSLLLGYTAMTLPENQAALRSPAQRCSVGRCKLLYGKSLNMFHSN